MTAVYTKRVGTLETGSLHTGHRVGGTEHKALTLMAGEGWGSAQKGPGSCLTGTPISSLQKFLCTNL